MIALVKIKQNLIGNKQQLVAMVLANVAGNISERIPSKFARKNNLNDLNNLKYDGNINKNFSIQRGKKIDSNRLLMSNRMIKRDNACIIYPDKSYLSFQMAIEP